MKRFFVVAAALASTALLAAPASAEIVKAPAGESSRLQLNASTVKKLKQQRVSVSSTGPARRSGSTVSMPYSLSRWDFAAREGDVVHFRKHTGLRFRRAGGRSIAMTHPRVILDGGNGYITALISNVRVKTFTFKLRDGRVVDTPRLQRISGLKLKLTKASALFLNQGLRRKVLKPFTQFGVLELRILKPAALASPGPGSGGAGATAPAGQTPGRGSTPGATADARTGIASALPAGGLLAPITPAVAVDLNGDGQPDADVFGLPLKSTTFSATTNTGTIALDGGFVVRAGGQDVLVLDDPEIVIGTTPATSGLFALVDGARVKVGDIDPNALTVNAADGTVTLSNLDVRVSTVGAALLAPLGIAQGSPLLTLDLSLPQR